MTTSISLHTDNEKNTAKVNLRKSTLDNGETFFTLNVDIGETELNIFFDNIKKILKFSCDIDTALIEIQKR